MRSAKVGLGVAVALVLQTQTTLDGLLERWGTSLDLMTVVVVYVGLTLGPVPGLLTGMFGGLAHDVLSPPGVIGLGSLVKTVVGFGVGVIGSHFIVAWVVPRFLVFFVASGVEAVGFLGLSSLVGPREFAVPYGAVVRHAVGNGVVGVVVFRLAHAIPGVTHRKPSAFVRRLGG